MRRSYELVYKEDWKSVKDFFPELIEEADSICNVEMDSVAENEDGFKIDFVISSESKPCYYSTALKYFGQGKDFPFLIWQDFQKFICEWLLFKGFAVREPINENGFINTETVKKYDDIGPIKCVWLIKKISIDRPVRLKVLRELEYIMFKSGANKGMIVTTSKLTKDALGFIYNNRHKFDYIDGDMLHDEFKHFRNNK